MTPTFRTMAWILFGILAVAFAPVLSVMVASGIAALYGCRLDEGNAHTCIVAGIDLADVLYDLFVLGWLMLATLPLGAMALLAWAIAAAVLYLRRKPANS